MSGLRTYFGNPISDHADHHLDLIGIGRLFAMSTDREMNTLSEIHYRHEFGERKIYRLKFSDEKVKSERDDKQGNFHSQWLFGKDVTYAKLASMLSKKARIKITNITDSYSFEQYKADNKQFVPLYTVDKEGKLHVITDNFDGVVPRDRKLISLVVDDEVQPKAVDVTAKQEQARAAADASFESSSKAPEKRKGIELTDASDDSTTSEAALTTAKEVNVVEASESEKAQDKQADSVTDTPNKTQASSTKVKKDNVQKTEPDAAPSSATNAINKGVMSDNSTATSKTKTSSSTNGNGSAPKTKKGTLDPNRLPDSSGDSL